MKLKLIAVLMLLAPTVHAAGVDCSRPLSYPGYQILAGNWYYTHDKGNAAAIGGGMSEACKVGKQWKAEGIPFKEIDARFTKMAWQWVDGVIGGQVEDKMTRGEIAYSIYAAGLSGFYGEPQPPYNPKAKDAIAAKKAAADKAAAEKKTAMNDVDDLFNDLKSGEKKPKPVPNHQNRSASNGIDVSSYASKIQMANGHNLHQDPRRLAVSCRGC